MAYVDNLLAISEDPKAIMYSLSMYDLKDTVIPPDQYLGANIGKWKFSEGSNYWWMNCRDYIANKINLTQKLMSQKGKVFLYGKRVKRPVLMSYRTELNVSQSLNPKKTQKYQQFVGIARWIIKLGRVDILYEVSLLSSHLDIPRKGHTEALMEIFFYLDKACGKTIVIYPVIPKLNTSLQFETNCLNVIYGEDNQE